MMIKVVGLGMVALGGIALGWGLSETLVRRARALGEARTAWRLLRARVVHLALPLPDALWEAGSVEGGDAGHWMADLSELLRSSGAVGDAVTESLDRTRGRLRGLTARDITAVARMFDAVSESDVAGLESAFDSGDATLTTLYDAAVLRCDKDRKLYKTLGALGGMAAALILW